jgi:hypothetical protein
MAKGEASNWRLMASCVNLVGHSVRLTGCSFVSHCLVVILCFFFSWLLFHVFSCLPKKEAFGVNCLVCFFFSLQSSQ